MRLLVWVLATLGLVVSFLGCVALAPTRGPAPRPSAVVTAVAGVPSAPLQATSTRIPVEPWNAVRGDPNAPVTVVAFLDLECSYCATAERTLEQLRQRYGDRLRIVVKHFPLEFHREAMPAARVAQAVLRAAGSAAFFRFIAAVYENQAALSEQSLRSWAERSGVAPAALDNELQNQAVDSAIRADMDLAARLGVTGTPEFRINGAVVSGAQSVEVFTAAIDAEIEAAGRLLRDGVPQNDVYRRRVAAQPPEPPPSDVEAPDTKVHRVPVAGSPVLGPPDALVTIVEFSDFECPFCKRVQSTLDEIMKRYPGQIRIVFKNNPLPFHPHAMPAAQLALEARAQKGDAAFFEVASALFAATSMDDTALLAIARAAKLDLTRVGRALKKTQNPSIDRDQLLADDFEARGTPHFFINGKRLSGAQPVENFIALIEPELARAKALVESGVARSAVYDKILERAEGPPEPEKKSVPPATAANPSRGPKNAPIVIHEFADFECPFCKRVLPTLQELEKAYPGKLRFVWHNLPLSFHQHANSTANAAMEAFAQRGATGFWAMHDLLFEHQSEPDGLERVSLDGYARRLGLDPKRFAAAIDGSGHRAAIDADSAVAKTAGITGTPAFVINGYFVSGAQPLMTFRRVVERALDELKKPRAP
jgi:protein-disulfide isomerase